MFLLYILRRHRSSNRYLLYRYHGKTGQNPRLKRRRIIMQFTVRVLAMLLGIFGVIIAFIINLLYSSLHVLGRVAGITNNQTHFFYGLLVILIGFIGSLLALFFPTVGAVLLVVAGIAFFFIAGWWALLASPFLLVAGVLAYRHSRQQQTVRQQERGMVQ